VIFVISNWVKANRSKLTLLAFVIGIILYGIHRYETEGESGYCSANKRYITDVEFLRLAVQLREKEIARFGGVDAYEKWMSINQKWASIDSAGRDFDLNNPNCCRVIRGRRQVRRHCGLDYPVCVKLNYQTSKTSIVSSDTGRWFFFDSCGNLEDPL
jgi:hypothetical protein